MMMNVVTTVSISIVQGEGKINIPRGQPAARNHVQRPLQHPPARLHLGDLGWRQLARVQRTRPVRMERALIAVGIVVPEPPGGAGGIGSRRGDSRAQGKRSEEHTSELQSRFGISYAV